VEQVELITARGFGRWGHERYEVELRTFDTTWTDQAGMRQVTYTGLSLHCSPKVGSRFFESDTERREFIAESFSELSLADLDPPERRVLPHSLAGLIGMPLEAVVFVADYLQLQWHASRFNVYVWPLLGQSGTTVARDDPAYVAGLVGLIGSHVRAVDELLDAGLVLSFGHATLTIPLGGDEGLAIAEFSKDGEFPDDHFGTIMWTAEAPFI
jgi:hypothetical protein